MGFPPGAHISVLARAKATRQHPWGDGVEAGAWEHPVQHHQPLALKKTHLKTSIATQHDVFPHHPGKLPSPGGGRTTNPVLHQVSYGNDARAGTLCPLWHAQTPSTIASKDRKPPRHSVPVGLMVINSFQPTKTSASEEGHGLGQAASGSAVSVNAFSISPLKLLL